MLPKVLLVKVEHDYIVVRVTGTSYTASSRKAPDSAQLLVKYLPPKSDHRAPYEPGGISRVRLAIGQRQGA